MCKHREHYSKIVSVIKITRQKNNLTQEALAEKADISVDTVRSIESGRRTMNLDTYLRICYALEMPMFAEKEGKQCEDHVARLAGMLIKRSSNEIEYVIHVVEQILKGQDSFFEK